LVASPHTFSHLFAVPTSALYPATTARQGGSVAASLVDSYELRTADKHRNRQQN